MEFLKALKDAISLGITKEEFIPIWEAELQQKTVVKDSFIKPQALRQSEQIAVNLRQIELTLFEVAKDLQALKSDALKLGQDLELLKTDLINKGREFYQDLPVLFTKYTKEIETKHQEFYIEIMKEDKLNGDKMEAGIRSLQVAVQSQMKHLLSRRKVSDTNDRSDDFLKMGNLPNESQQVSNGNLPNESQQVSNGNLPNESQKVSNGNLPNESQKVSNGNLPNESQKVSNGNLPNESQKVSNGNLPNDGQKASPVGLPESQQDSTENKESQDQSSSNWYLNNGVPDEYMKETSIESRSCPNIPSLVKTEYASLSTNFELILQDISAGGSRHSSSWMYLQGYPIKVKLVCYFGFDGKFHARVTAVGLRNRHLKSEKTMSGLGRVKHATSERFSQLFQFTFPSMVKIKPGVLSRVEAKCCLETSRASHPEVTLATLEEKNFISNNTAVIAWNLNLKESKT
ncbi:unnamed protein product [Lymnaea stagnalis]|uniref:Uncharacterized protein n=1 Tax=Lymnaea stagnalis TaxID=6523 RepID=A0AAV2HJ33_LYMST